MKVKSESEVAEPWVLKNLSLEKLEFSLKTTIAREDCIIILNILGGKLQLLKEQDMKTIMY